MGKLFSDIVGQDTAVKILTAQLSNDSLSHAYIFLGENGTGKEYLAREFAKYILCDKHTDDDCDSCKNFSHNAHPDFIYIDGTEGIKIEQVREAIERVSLSPNLSKRKVLLFRKAENLGIEAANALLKTFEEPPLDSVIILTAVSEKSLPETINSRGQKIKLRTIGQEEAKKILLKKYSEEDIDRVLAITEGNLAEAKKYINEPEKMEAKKEIFSDIEILLNSRSAIEKFKVIEKYDKTKELSLREFFDIFSKVIYRSLAAMLAGKEDPTGVGVSDDYTPSRLAGIATKTLKISDNLEYNVNLKIALEEIILDNTLN
jgi:DNA polymerase-3 subunit delta'